MADISSGAEEYGGFWRRLFAFFCDSLIASAILYFLLALAVRAGVDVVLAANALSLLVVIGYFAVMQASAAQATIGKKLLGLKVATADGERASLLRMIGRELAKIVSWITLGIGFLLAAFTGRKQALHDMIASSVVLHVGPAKPLVGALVVIGAVALNTAIITFMLADALTTVMEQAKAAANEPREEQAPAPRSVVAAAPKQAPPAPAPLKLEAKSEAPAPTPAPEPKVAAATPIVPAVSEVPAPTPAPAAVAKKTERPAAPPVAAAAEVKREVEPMIAVVERPSTPGPKFNDLMTAVLYRDVAAVEELLAFGKWADKPDDGGATPLMIAVKFGDAASAEALLKAGADPEKARSAAAGRPAMQALLEKYLRSTSRRP